jgi:hypothetical protein
MAESEFKTRFYNHTLSFKNKDYANKTALSKFIWDLKKTKRDYEIKWSILKQAKPYASGTRVCKLCLAEKMAILNAHKGTLLNKRSELVSKCQHENKFYASNVT